MISKPAEVNSGTSKKRLKKSADLQAHTGETIARLLTQEGLLTQDQLTYAKRVRSKLVSERSLVEVIKDLGFIAEPALSQVLKSRPVEIRIGDLLVELGYIRSSDLESALAIQKEAAETQKIGDILVEYGFIDEYKLIEILATKLGYPFLVPKFASIDRELLQQIPLKMINKHCFVPIVREGHRLLVSFADPLDIEDREAADRIFGRLVVPAIGPRQAIRETLELYRRGSQLHGEEVDDSTVIGAVNALLDDALKQGASDIHIEPMRDRVRVRFRCDGVLMTHREFGLDLAPGLVSRLKIMADADIAERRRHQDGRILYESPATGIALDLRVSFYITVHGEKVVLRLLNKKAELLDIKDIGMAPRMLQRFRDDALDSPSGIMIVTGPTGAGKTTTLYSCVHALNDLETSIITAEEPVEYVIDGVAQCSINPKIGVTFTETLRHIVRQDPDIIVMGEVRDTFSAETAIQAALTGHKVLTTFHTEDTVGGLLRLLNMEIEPFLVASTITCMVAQRLLRRVCPNCAVPYAATPEEFRRLGYTHESLAGAELLIGRGCSACRFTGHQGRVGIFELLILNEAVKDAILARKTVHEIRKISIEKSGLITLMEDGIVKAAKGQVSLQEILRRLPRVERPRALHELRRLQGD